MSINPTSKSEQSDLDKVKQAYLASSVMSDFPNMMKVLTDEILTHYIPRTKLEKLLREAIKAEWEDYLQFDLEHDPHKLKPEVWNCDGPYCYQYAEARIKSLGGNTNNE